jgi:hypothetical protein
MNVYISYIFQLSAIASRYMEFTNFDDLANLTSENVTMLGPILCGLEPYELLTLRPQVFRFVSTSAM